jgi:Fe(3+) dicitrate transport protein
MKTPDNQCSRNWFGTPWNVFSLNFDTKITSRLSSNTKLFGLVGERNSGFTATPNM